MIYKALTLAYKAHKGQKDKRGCDYILHPLRVALMTKSDTDKVVALLHDVVEDTDISIDTIRVEFGDEVAEAVSLLTNTDKEYLDYLTKIKYNDIARRVKLCDLTDNLDPERTFKGRDTTKYEKAFNYLKYE